LLVGGPVGHKLSLYMGGWARRSQATELKCRTTTSSLFKIVNVIR